MWKPFACAADQFRRGLPAALTPAKSSDDLDEVESMGLAASTTATADETAQVA